MRILAIPFSGGSLGKNLGTEKAPEEIINILNSSLREDKTIPVFKVENVNVDRNNFSQTHSNVESSVAELKEGFIAVGGDHSLTYPLFKAFSQNHKNAGIVVFDAHPDLMQEFKPVTHENYLRTLIEDGFLKPENVILVGLRSIDVKEASYLKIKNIRHYTMKQVYDLGMQDLMDAVMEQARDWGALYISVDIDAADPAFAPGTGYPESGGMSAREMIYCVQRLKLLQNYKAADLVEVNPAKDVNGITVNLAAKIIRELS